MIAESIDGVDEEIARGVRRDGKHHHLVMITQRSAYRFSPSLKLAVGPPLVTLLATSYKIKRSAYRYAVFF